MNKVILIGRLCKDNEFKHTAQGLEICENTIAVSEKIKDKEKTMFIKISLFGGVCRLMRDYSYKGQKVAIEGKLNLNEWTDQKGTRHHQHSIIVESIELLEFKRTAQATPAQATPAQKNQQVGGFKGVQEVVSLLDLPKSNNPQNVDIADDEIPF